MGEIGKWLRHEDQKDLFEFLFAGALNLVFLALITLLLWPLGKVALAIRLAAGYIVLWIVIVVTVLLVSRIQKSLGVNLYDHPNAFVISNLVVSCFLQVSWSVFAALSVAPAVAGAANPSRVLLYLVGGTSCLLAFFVVSAFYQGHIYKFISLPLALISFIVFSLWPAP